MGDGSPLGSGEPNRHGMPKLPPDQTPTVDDRWPVLDLGGQPSVSLEKWRLRVDGAVEEPVVLDWRGFQDLPQVDDVSDFHCVTGWSKLDVRWRGVRLSTVLALARPAENASHLL